MAFIKPFGSVYWEASGWDARTQQRCSPASAPTHRASPERAAGAFLPLSSPSVRGGFSGKERARSTLPPAGRSLGEDGTGLLRSVPPPLRERHEAAGRCWRSAALWGLASPHGARLHLTGPGLT